jgi:hypothetical protein
MSAILLESTTTREPRPAAAFAEGGDARQTDSLNRAPGTQELRLTPVQILQHAENMARLAQPFVLGVAVNDLLRQSYGGLAAFAALSLLALLLSASRQMFATRVYARLRGERFLRQNDRAGEPDDARAGVCDEWLEFREHGAPQLLRAGYNVVGSLAILTWYDWRIAPLCLLLVLPAALLHAAHDRRVSLLFGGDFVVEDRDNAEGAARRARHRVTDGNRLVRLADADALNFCLMQLFVLGLTAAALIQYCSSLTPQPGDVLAVLGYLWLFAAGLGAAPQLLASRACLRRRTADRSRRTTAC